MPATITILGNNEADKTFDEVIADFDEMEQRAREAGVAVTDVMKAMDEDRAKKYADEVKRVASSFDEAAEKARRAEEHAEKVARMERRFTAVASGVSAVRDGFDMAAGMADRAYQVIDRLAMRGDEGMIQLKRAIDDAGGSMENLAGRFLSFDGELTPLGKSIRNAASDVNWLTAALAGLTEAEARQAEQSERWKAGIEAVDQAISNRRLAEAISEIEDLTEAQKQLADVEQRIADYSQMKGGSVDEETRTKLLAQRAALTQQVDQLEKKRQADERAFVAEMMTAVADRAKLQEEKDKEELARRREMELRIQVLKDRGRSDAERSERQARQAEAEHHLKVRGLDEEIHKARISFLEAEMERAVRLANTEEEKVSARLEGERRIRDEMHQERLAQIDREAEKEKKAKEEAEKKERESLKARMGQGDTFREVAFDRQQDAVAQFQEQNKERIQQINDPNSRMTPAERQREMIALNKEFRSLILGVRHTLREEQRNLVSEQQAEAREERRIARESRDRPDAMSPEEQRAELARRREQEAERRAALQGRADRLREREPGRRDQRMEEMERVAEQARREAEQERERVRREMGQNSEALAREQAQQARAEFQKSAAQVGATEALMENNAELRANMEEMTRHINGLRNMIGAETRRASAIRRSLGR